MADRRKLLLYLATAAILATGCVEQNPGGGGGTPPIVGSVSRIASGGTMSEAAISRNGRWVAFVSTASTPGTDGNGAGPDVFLHDSTTSTTVRVSGGNAASDSPSVADDGSVVFRSASTDMGAAGTHGRVDVFRWTSGSGAVRVTDSPADVTAPVVSADGDTVAFGAPERLTQPLGSTRLSPYVWKVSAPTFVALDTIGTDGASPVAVTSTGDRVLLVEPGRLSEVEIGGATTLVASAPPSPPSPRTTTFAVAPHALADDGDVVYAEITYSFDAAGGVASFESGAAARWDRQSATTTPLSLPGLPAGPVQSVDGRHVVALDLTAVTVDQDDGAAFLRGAVKTLDTSNGAQATVAAAAQATVSTVSGDGRYVAFVSTDPSLVAPDPGPGGAVYLWDRGS